MMKKKVLSLFLALVMVLGLLPVGALAASEAFSIDLSKYTTSIGTFTVDGQDFPVYEVYVDGSTYNSINFVKNVVEESDSYKYPYNVYTGTESGVSGGTTNGSVLEISEDVINDAKAFYTSSVSDIVFESSRNDNEENAYLLFRIRAAKTAIKQRNHGYVIINWSQITGTGDETVELVNKNALDALIDSVDETAYYTTGDRYNGKATSVNGFYADMQSALTEAKSVNDNAKATQAQVDAAAEALTAAIANLIPTTQVNATELYEELSYKDQWKFGDTNRPLSELTESVQQDYMTAYNAAKAFFDTLYDADGNATAANTAAAQTAVNSHTEAVKAIRTGAADETMYAADKDSYNQIAAAAKKFYAENTPENYDQSAFTAESWDTFTAAYADMGSSLAEETTFADRGGYESDRVFYATFTWRYEQLAKAVSNLISTVPVTVNFTYVDNAAARQDPIRNVAAYANPALTLEPGKTNPLGAMNAAGVAAQNYRDYLVYVNGAYVLHSVGGNIVGVQLREGDVVRIVCTDRIQGQLEVSTGENSTSIETGNAREFMYRDSIAQISLTAPETVVVGEKAALTVSVAGVTDEAKAKTFSPEGLSLFVSDPDGSTLTKLTLSTADANGSLSYVFPEPGVYTVGVFNRTEDVLAQTNVFGATTAGAYYSCWAGDIQTVTVTAAEDEAALLAQYREENLAKAQAYYAQFTANDFAAGVYDNLTSAYNTLVSNQNAAESLKALMDAYDTDYPELEKIGAMKVDHEAQLAYFRNSLAKMPDDPTLLDNSYELMVQTLQYAYSLLNEYERTLLTAAEAEKYAAIAAYVAEHPDYADPGAPITVKFPYAAGDYTPSKETNHYAAAPNDNIVYRLFADGSKDYDYFTGYKWGTNGDVPSGDMTAYRGNEIRVRRLVVQSEAQYWMAFSVDGGETWVLPTETQDAAVATDRFFIFSYVIPKDYEGGELTILAKAISRSEYEELTAADVASAKAEALASLEAAYSAYNEADYSAENWAALTKAYEDGRTAIESSTSTDDAAAARRSAVAAMAIVEKKDSGSAPSEGSSYDSGATVGRVQVIVENTTYSDAPFTGYIVNDTYALGENDSMMTMVLKALEAAGYTWSGTGGETYDITYLSSIRKDGKSLGEFDGGNMSGWMGTLNDWFTNEGFASFTVANGKLENGDVIRVMYTCDYGADIGGTWNSNDTSLKNLTASIGTLTPDFSGSVTEYTLILDSETANVKLSYEAANKNYQARTYLNNYNVDSAYYKQSETLGVKVGDVIYVGVGESGWPTMNTGGTPTKYVIYVKDMDEALDDLPDAGTVTMSNYKDYQALVETYKAKLNGAANEKLDALEQRVIFFAEIDNVRTLLAAIPAADKLTTADKSKVQAARAAYDKLSEEQTMHITLADTAKYNAAVEWLAGQGVDAGEVITRNPDKEAAAAVVAAIEAIGEVTVDSAEAVKAARDAYDALTDEQKKLVSNYDVLLAAEKALEELGVKPVGFIDVAENAWYADAVDYVSAKGIMNGTAENIFSPDARLSRAMLVTILARIDGEDTAGGATWYEKGRDWAMENGISDGTAMDNDITREQLVVMLYRYAQKLGLDTSARADLSGFDDAEDISAWALEAVQWAVSAGLVKGTSDTSISPLGTATRAQAATLIMRFMDSMALCSSLLQFEFIAK